MNEHSIRLVVCGSPIKACIAYGCWFLWVFFYFVYNKEIAHNEAVSHNLVVLSIGQA